MKTTTVALTMALSAVLAAVPAVADSDSAERERMRQELADLRVRIEILEALRPTFTEFMPAFAERFHVIHRAGEVGDWAVAAHEVSEMQRLSRLSTAINEANGKLMQAMLSPQLEKLEKAIKREDKPEFDRALGETLSSCNVCHVATGSPFIKVTLNAAQSLSLRHPHALGRSDPVPEHGHGEAQEEGEGHDEKPGEGHDEKPGEGHDEKPAK